MRYLTLGEVVTLHRAVVSATGGAEASVDEQERLMLDLAAGRCPRDELATWLAAHVVPSVTG